MNVTVQDILKLPGITPVHLEADRAVENVFCCDLLSVAMARAPESCAWVTVIGNNNAVAVGTLADASVIILAEGYEYDEAAGDPENGIPAGTKFEDLPDDWTCPLCGVDKSNFKAE